MRTTNLLLDLNPTFNNCIPTFGPPCIITYVMSVDLSVELLLRTLDLVAFIVLLQH